MNKGDYYIATQAIESVNKQVEHLNLNLKLTEIEYSHSNYINDFNLELRYNDKLYNFDVEVKRNLINKTALLSFHELITNRENKILFVSDYISNEIKKYFRKHSISYISIGHLCHNICITSTYCFESIPTFIHFSLTTIRIIIFK